MRERLIFRPAVVIREQGPLSTNHDLEAVESMTRGFMLGLLLVLLVGWLAPAPMSA